MNASKRVTQKFHFTSIKANTHTQLKKIIDSGCWCFSQWQCYRWQCWKQCKFWRNQNSNMQFLRKQNVIN